MPRSSVLVGGKPSTFGGRLAPLQALGHAEMVALDNVELGVVPAVLDTAGCRWCSGCRSATIGLVSAQRGGFCSRWAEGETHDLRAAATG